ncbi:hypothetical protein N499_1036A, partial [Wolbachia pipientis wVitA]
MKLFIYLLCT